MNVRLGRGDGEESYLMFDIAPWFTLFATILFPCVGGYTLLATKLSSGESKRFAERQFIATLLVVTLFTMHTVVTCDGAWLLHTLTLSTMIVGALALPSHDASMAA